MEKGFSDMMLAHYMYLPAEDYRIAKDIWDGLAQRYSLTGFKLGDAALDEVLSSYDFPLLVRGEGVAVGFSIIRDIIIIELLYLSGPRGYTEIHDDLEKARQSVSIHAAFLAGETTVTVIGGATDGGLSDSAILALTGPKTSIGDIRGGILSFVHCSDSLRRFYTIEQENATDITNILAASLPAVDMLIFKLERQANYFKDQRSFTISKKSDMDRNIGDILSQWTGTGSPHDANLGLLEKDIEKLSLAYGELAGSLKLIKSAHDTLARDLEALELSMDELMISPEGLERFRSIIVGGYKNLLRQLKFDDELLHRSLDDTRATIEVVRTRVELERSRESFLLQQEGISIQIAAGFIELFIIGFYTLEAWELLASKEVFEHMPAFIRLGLDALFAVTIVIFTHYVAKRLRKEGSNLKLMLSGVSIIISLLLMVIATSYFPWG